MCHCYNKQNYDRFIELCIVTISLLLVTGIIGSRPLSDSQKINDDDDWESFKQRFKKSYATKAEDDYRRSIRARNLVFVQQHNAAAATGKFNFTLGENSLIDLTTEEYRKMLGYRTSRSVSTRSKRSSYPPDMPVYRNTVSLTTLPATVNWTTKGWVGPVENQGQCGSCWSYSAAGSLEAQYFNATGQFVQLSEQNLIDCSWPEGNEGCNGGNVQNSYWYVQQYGIEPLSLYPDTSNVTGSAISSSCAYSSSLSVMNVNSWRNIATFSEPALQQAVALVGPVSAAIDADSIYFQLYSSGVYSNPLCSSTLSSLDHAILVVGYGVNENVSYWLIQNSWGTSWGINGYMMMARDDDNMCGIATDATFPVAGWTTTVVGSGSAVLQSSEASAKSNWASSAFIAYLLYGFVAVAVIEKKF